MCAALLSGCATTERKGGVAARSAASLQRQQVASERQAADVESRFATIDGSPRIKISLSAQEACFYKGDQLVTTSRVSTGKPGHSTPRGSFRISQKELQHYSSRYGKFVDGAGNTVDSDADSSKARPCGARFVGAPMPYFMRFNGGIGMHAGYVPNYPASHGCVRLPRQMAQIFYENAPVGTPVIVTD